VATEAETAESAAMAAVMAAAAVLLVAEVMALMMLHVWRWRLLAAAVATRAAEKCPSSGNLRRPWVGLAWIRKET
jgi:hypothetical protein